MQLNTAIDRQSYVPLYVQVKDSLKDLIDSGGRAPGEQLPGEPELCRLYDVSRTVIRQALRDLELEGLITRAKGRGTFVAEPKLREGLFQELTGFYDDMAGKGRPPVSQVLAQEVIPASPKIAGFLRLREVSGSYNLPKSLMGRIGVNSGTLTVAGRNLMMLWTQQDGWSTSRDGLIHIGIANQVTWDPEIRAVGQLSNGFQTIMPPTASFVTTLRLTF